MIIEKHITLETLAKKAMDVLHDILRTGVVYRVTAPMPAEGGGFVPSGMVSSDGDEDGREDTSVVASVASVAFVLGPSAICGQVLGLYDVEYGWPALVRADSIASATELAPGYRRHPVIVLGDTFREKETINSVMIGEYEDILDRQAAFASAAATLRVFEVGRPAGTVTQRDSSLLFHHRGDHDRLRVREGMLGRVVSSKRAVDLGEALGGERDGAVVLPHPSWGVVVDDATQKTLVFDITIPAQTQSLADDDDDDGGGDNHPLTILNAEATELEFLLTLVRNPRNSETRVVFGDWLETQGRKEEAAFLRALPSEKEKDTPVATMKALALRTKPPDHSATTMAGQLPRWWIWLSLVTPPEVALECV